MSSQRPDGPDGALLSSSLSGLAAEDRSLWSFQRLWARMPVGLRAEAVAAFLESPEHRQLHPLLLDRLAKVAGFRPQTLERMETEEVSRFAGRLPARKLPAPAEVIRVFLTAARPAMLVTYLDRLGVSHEGGRVTHEPEDPVDPAEARAAAEALLRAFPPNDAVVYLVALSLMNPNLASGIDDWVRERFAAPAPGPRTPGGRTEAEPPPAPAEGPEGETPEPEVIREARGEIRDENAVPGSPFTALDRLLIRAAVDSAQGVVGSPDRATVEDMVDEVVELNSSRHASFFHRGFVDGLHGRERRGRLPAENERRREWYLAGWLSALARLDRPAEIATLLDEDPHVRKLAGAGSDAADLALPILFRALCRSGREPEGARLLSAEDLLRNLTLLPELLEEGTRLLREDDAERARPFFDRLGEVVRELEVDGEPTTERFFLEIRRRRAHCYRQLGEVERARDLLDRLLSEDPDPDVQAMVLADLGLLDAGFRSLADVRLWRTEAERHDLAEQLERGRARFERARATESRFSSHGGWPLGVVALARGEWDQARELLSHVLSSFLERAARYRSRNLLARVRVAAGIAEALVMEYGRLPRARDLLLAGLGEGARIPQPLLAGVLGALGAHDEGLAGQVLERVLEVEGAEVLDVLHDAEVVRSTPAAARHLIARAEDRGLRSEARAKDLRRALTILLSSRSPDLAAARGAIDRMEALAHAGVAQEAYLELLSEPGRVDPAWSADDAAWARVAVHEARQEYEEAIMVLRDRFAAVLAEHRWTAGEEADAIVSRIRSYGLGPEWTEDLERRLEAWRRELGTDEEAEAPLAPRHPNQPRRILIVGGDERQHGLEARVQQRLDTDDTGISVRHLATGWSGNWSHTLEEALREARRHDAVVLLRFMRTEFGRSLRAELGDTPWVSCPGVGTLQVARMAKKAARFAGD